MFEIKYRNFLSVLSREAEGQAQRSLGNNRVAECANSCRGRPLKDKKRAAPPVCLIRFLSMDKKRFFIW